MKDMKKGIHSLKILKDKIRVESNFGKESMISNYRLDEYAKALACYNRLVSTSKTED